MRGQSAEPSLAWVRGRSGAGKPRPRGAGSRESRCYTEAAAMKLIATPTCPYARKVRVVLAEKKIEYVLIDVSPPAFAETAPPTG